MGADDGGTRVCLRQYARRYTRPTLSISAVRPPSLRRLRQPLPGSLALRVDGLRSRLYAPPPSAAEGGTSATKGAAYQSLRSA
jgi:hypothetical protein